MTDRLTSCLAETDIDIDRQYIKRQTDSQTQKHIPTYGLVRCVFKHLGIWKEPVNPNQTSNMATDLELIG